MVNFENRYLENLYKIDYFSARRLNNTFRLIDDITSINSDGVFNTHYKHIYPENLVLNKENKMDDSAHVLDLQVCILNGKFDVSLYDKRNDFPSNIVQFISLDSNISRNSSYGVFASQVIRYFRICNSFVKFEERFKKLLDVLIELNYSRDILKSKFIRISEKHKFKSKFNEIDKLRILFEN